MAYTAMRSVVDLRGGHAIHLKRYAIIYNKMAIMDELFAPWLADALPCTARKSACACSPEFVKKSNIVPERLLLGNTNAQTCRTFR